MKTSAIAMAAAILALTGAGANSASETLRSVAASYYAKAGQIAVLTGRDSAMDYYQRLLDDADSLGEPAPGLSPADQLDLSLATQLLRQSYRPMESIRGLGETFVRSSKDGTMQPVAVYVPASYSPERPAALLVFLHGRLQAESHLIAPAFIDDLAERTNTIIVAPYGRGHYDFHGSDSDVYDALEAALHAFAIDRHKRYLAGYSMGGFSVFRIAPMHPEDWSAVMSISGSLLKSRAELINSKMRTSRFYVLTGARDPIVPTLYSALTAVYLHDSGVSVAFYSQPDGTHLLSSLRPILSQALGDMERGVVRYPEWLNASGGLPEAGQ